MNENNANAQEAVIKMTIQITRKETGKVEEYELIGTPIEQPEAKEEQ